MNGKRDYVEVTVTLKLPKKVNDFLEDFAKFAGVTVEDILSGEIEGNLNNLRDRGFIENWIDTAFEKHGISKELMYNHC